MSDRHFWAAGMPEPCSADAPHGCVDCVRCGEEYNVNRMIIWICLLTGALVDEGCRCPDWKPKYNRYWR